MNVPTDRKYSKSHEWFKPQGDLVTIGITQFAADELTDITFVDLPKVGGSITAGSPFGEVESVKATSDLMTLIGGEVVEVNGLLADQPGLVNSDPYNSGWMIKVRATDPTLLNGLMDAPAYQRMIDSPSA